jgi:hypothetical protein
MGQIQLWRQANMGLCRRRRVKNVSLWESLRLVFININQAGAAGATWHRDTRQRTVKQMLLAVVPLLPCSDFLWIRAMYMRSDPLQCTCDDSLLVHRHRSPPGSSLYCPESSANSAHECRNGYNYNKHGLHRHGPDCIDVQKYQEGRLHLTEHIT